MTPDALAPQRARRHGAVERSAAASGLACTLGRWLQFVKTLSWRACRAGATLGCTALACPLIYISAGVHMCAAAQHVSVTGLHRACMASGAHAGCIITKRNVLPLCRELVPSPLARFCRWPAPLRARLGMAHSFVAREWGLHRSLRRPPGWSACCHALAGGQRQF